MHEYKLERYHQQYLTNSRPFHASVSRPNAKSQSKSDYTELPIWSRYRQQPSPLLYNIDFWPARKPRLTQRETYHYIARCASVLA